MVIATSLGSTFDTEGQFHAHQWDPESYDNNVIDPDTTLDLNSQDQNEVKPQRLYVSPDTTKPQEIADKTASTMPLGSSTEPAGALKSQRGTDTPDSLIAAASKRAMTLLDPNAPKAKVQDDPAIQGYVKGPNTNYLITNDDPNVDQAMNIVMSFGAGTIAGVNSKTASAATNWFRGSDGNMKYEIPDEGMKLADKDWRYGEEGKLSDFIDHPELFKAYPDLKDMNFKVADKDFPYLGGYNSISNSMTINPDKIKGGDQGLLDVISHELQHAVQVREGFDTGSNPERALTEAGLALKSKMIEAAKAKDDTTMQGLLKLYLDIHENAKKFAEYMYQRSPGEVEANTVMSRRSLTPELRQAFPPLESQKILQGSDNTMTGGKYYPEFRYPEGNTLSNDISASTDITHFRRAANDNTPGLYNPREPGMIGSAEQDALIDKQWVNFGKMQKLDNQIEDIHKGRAYGDLTPFEKKRVDKLQKEYESLSPK